MEVFQTQFELDQMVTLCRILKPEAVLEVGAWDGGTLVEWLRIADRVVVIDDRMRRHQEWQEIAEMEDTELHLLAGDSHNPEIVAAAAERGPYDWVFIDADHTYSAVKADWENFSPMVSPGGAVAFHDIFPRADYGVSDLWRELKTRPGARWLEIGETLDPPIHGIGVIWV